jgi:uncharacterized protein YndB with AHSA1/START domain
MMEIPPPNLPRHSIGARVQLEMRSPPAELFRALTTGLDSWLAEPGTLIFEPRANTAFYFETGRGEERQPYYGRIVDLAADSRLVLTWLSTGTERAETLLTVQLTRTPSGTRLELTHTGFLSLEYRDAHQTTWPILLSNLDEELCAAAALKH